LQEDLKHILATRGFFREVPALEQEVFEQAAAVRSTEDIPSCAMLLLPLAETHAMGAAVVGNRWCSPAFE
jgi:hypothetical protein